MRLTQPTPFWIRKDLDLWHWVRGQMGDSLFKKRAVPDLLNKCPKFPPGIWFFWEVVVFSRVNQPLIRYTHPSSRVVPSFCFLDGNFQATLSCFSSLKKKWGIVLGQPKEDPRGAREGLCLFKAEHVFVVWGIYNHTCVLYIFQNAVDKYIVLSKKNYK